MNETPKIYYTKTDEAPMLATYSWLAVVEKYLAKAGVEVELKDISLAGRIIARFPEQLKPEQRIPDELKFLGELAKTPEANIIKLPNISASVPQLEAAIAELQSKGFAVPNYPTQPNTAEEKEVRAIYDSIKGSAVNPVLREGNSDRRAPQAVKNFAKKNPHSMGAWQANSQSHVASMTEGDFFHNELAHTLTDATELNISLTDSQGTKHTLKEGLAVEKGEIIDATFMSKKKLVGFLETQLHNAKEQGILFSLHMKATMMKVSDPIIFGHAVQAYLKPVFDKHGATLTQLKANPNNGLGDLLDKIATLPTDIQQQIQDDIAAQVAQMPDLAMVNSDKGITNLHVPSDVIIDASMPAMIRSSGQMWNKEGALQDTKAVIPDSSYASVYQACIDFCKKHGAFDPTTMGTVPNVGLMAKKAEEYGSHDKTFEIPADGVVEVTDATGNVLLKHQVEQGDIWRMCQTKDAPIKDWVKLAVNRAQKSGMTAVFWLDPQRAHDAELLKKVNAYLPEHDTEGLDLQFLSPYEAATFTLDRIKKGADTISVTGNVLRDYLTDLFPILELGTSAKMLSIVPLMQGGGLFETGAGGSAPKHVEQFETEGHLRWDSLGEFLALVPSLELLAERFQKAEIKVLANCLDRATEQLLQNNQSPKRKCGELDTRGSHFHLAHYWAQELAQQSESPKLQQAFLPLADELKGKEGTILQELLAAQGKAANVGGYYLPDDALASQQLQASQTFNRALDLL